MHVEPSVHDLSLPCRTLIAPMATLRVGGQQSHPGSSRGGVGVGIQVWTLHLSPLPGAQLTLLP